MTGAILFILLGAIQIVFVVRNRMLSNKDMAHEERKRHVKEFVALGSLGFLLTVTIGVRNWKIQEAQAGTQEKIQGDLQNTEGELQSARKDLNDSRLAQEFMKGQLNSLSVLVKSVGDSGQLNGKDLAGYLANMAGSSGSSELALSNQQLKVRTFDLARRMRDFEKRYAEGMKSFVMDLEEDSPGQKEQEAEEKEMREHEEAEFRAIFLDEGNSIRLELLRRLRKPSSHGLPLAFEGELAGASPISDAAGYLESLAKQLPTN